MEETFTIHVQYNEKDLYFEAALLRLGYTHKFKVTVDGTDVLFEPDEEGDYRAVLPDVFDEKAKRAIDSSLLQAIAETISSS